MSSIALAVFFWAINNGQFDDLETPVYRVLMEDKTPAPANHPVTPPSGDNVA
jgi:cbb3-type cytochrome oxidase maturation protein